MFFDFLPSKNTIAVTVSSNAMRNKIVYFVMLAKFGFFILATDLLAIVM